MRFTTFALMFALVVISVARARAKIPSLHHPCCRRPPCCPRNLTASP